MIEGISGCAAPMLGGFLTGSLSCRWCFYTNLPLGGITFFLILFFFQDPQPDRASALSLEEKIREIDLLETAVFIPSVTYLLLATQEVD